MLPKATTTKWQDKEPTDEEKKIFKECLVQYIIENDKNITEFKATIKNIAVVIPLIDKRLRHWRNINRDNFEYNFYKAHIIFYHSLRNLIQNKKLLQSHIDEYLDPQRDHNANPD